MQFLPTIEEENRLTWLHTMWRYRLQFQAMGSPCAVLVAGGMKMAWSVFESPPSSIDNAGRSTYALASSWFFGVIFGAIIATTFVQRVTKNAAYFSGGTLLVLGGLLFTIYPISYGAQLGSCIVEGCAYGLVLIQALITGSEVAHKDMRGLLLSLERIAIWLGVTLQLVCTHLWYEYEPKNGYHMHPHRLHGGLIVFFGILAISLAILHRLESPLLLQSQHHDSIATWTIKRFHGIREQPSMELLRMRDDYKQLLIIDAGLTRCTAFWHCNAFALLKVILLRCFIALSISLPFNRAFLTVGWIGLECKMNCVILLAITGLIGSCIGSSLIDSNGRRKLSMVTLLLSGIFIFLAGGIFRQLQIYDLPVCLMDLEMAAYLMLLHQFFASLGYSIVSTVYAAEAFTNSMKGKCIAIMIVCEYLLYISLITMAYHMNYTYWILFFTMGSLSLLFALLVFLFMPETSSLSLIECLLKFQKIRIP